LQRFWPRVRVQRRGNAGWKCVEIGGWVARMNSVAAGIGLWTGQRKPPVAEANVRCGIPPLATPSRATSHRAQSRTPCRSIERS